MSTLRITNIEAKADPSSPTVDEKIKLTNSNGDILVHIDGKTSGITTIGINTTAGNIKFDQNSNVVVTGIITATKFVGTIEPTSLEIGSNIKLGNAGVITATSYVGDGSALTGIDATQIQTGNTSVQTVDTGSDGHVKITTEGTERIRVDNAGNVGINETSPSTTGFGSILRIKGVSGVSGLFAEGASGSAWFGFYSGDSTVNTPALLYPYNGGLRIGTTNSVGTGGFAEKLRIDSSGRVMIGTQTVGPTAGEQLTIADSVNAGITIRSGTTAAGTILFEDDTADRGEIQYSHNGDYMRFKVAGSEAARFNSSGNLAFPSGQGVDFSDTANSQYTMSSELFDDYEEGTWTPTMGFATSYGTQSGKYVKVGKTVHIWFEIQVTGWSTYTGSTRITSSPFPIDKVTGCWAGVINATATTRDWRVGPWTAGGHGMGVWMENGAGSATSAGIRMSENTFSDYSSLTGSLGTNFTMKGGMTYISTT